MHRDIGYLLTHGPALVDQSDDALPLVGDVTACGTHVNENTAARLAEDELRTAVKELRSGAFIKQNTAY